MRHGFWKSKPPLSILLNTSPSTSSGHAFNGRSTVMVVSVSLGTVLPIAFRLRRAHDRSAQEVQILHRSLVEDRFELLKAMGMNEGFFRNIDREQPEDASVA